MQMPYQRLKAWALRTYMHVATTRACAASRYGGEHRIIDMRIGATHMSGLEQKRAKVMRRALMSGCWTGAKMSHVRDTGNEGL
eukprot:5140231-Alexandrium_andersonii.AAC.1